MARTRGATFDASLQLCDGQTITADDITQVDSSDAIIDLGSDSNVSGMLWVDVSALAIDGNDETYELQLQGSSSATFASTIENVPGCLRLGALEVVSGTGAAVADVDSTTGVYQVPFTNDIGGTTYRYLRLAVITAGSTKSITIDNAYLAIDK